MPRYIDAEKLKEDVTSVSSQRFWDWHTAEVIAVIDGQKPADVAIVKHGKWGKVSDDDQYEGLYICSECKAEEFMPEEEDVYEYCPHCGALMDGKSTASPSPIQDHVRCRDCDYLCKIGGKICCGYPRMNSRGLDDWCRYGKKRGADHDA